MNATALCLHKEYDSALWQRCEVFYSAMGALWARGVHDVKMIVYPVFGVGVCNFHRKKNNKMN